MPPSDFPLPRHDEPYRITPGGARSIPPQPMTFDLGRLLATPGAIRALQDAGETALPYVRRHLSGDWGAVGLEDRQANERALKAGGRLLSAYALGNGERIWIITEADRSATTVLLPDEY